MIQDKALTKFKGIKPIEISNVEADDLFLDGPVSRRVAVLDFLEDGKGLRDPVPFRPPGPGGGTGGYVVAGQVAGVAPGDVNEPKFLGDPAFIQVSVFATVLKTMRLFEDALGREVRWAFEGTHLFVVPNAGTWRNAFYDRETHSLQFFSFEPRKASRRVGRVYTSLSQDIVAHETAHALVDGIAPDLEDALTPQGSALPEAIADITAVLLAFQTEPLVDALVHWKSGRIPRNNACSWIAEEFQESAGDPGQRGHALRSLYNKWTLDSTPAQKLGGHDPHGLSLVLSGGLYSILLRLYDKFLVRKATSNGHSRMNSKEAIMKTSLRCSELFLRALDYLPPGEVSFADYGRAILAGDQDPTNAGELQRKIIRTEFKRRKIFNDTSEMMVSGPPNDARVEPSTLDTLKSTDWTAREFAETNRHILRMPTTGPFEVYPRVYLARAHEVLFKVFWEEEGQGVDGEPLVVDGKPLAVGMGTTMAIDGATGRIRVVVTSDRHDRLRNSRSQRLEELNTSRWLQGSDAQVLGPTLRESPGVGRLVPARTRPGFFRVRGTSRLMHVAPGGAAGQQPPKTVEVRPDTELVAPRGVDIGAFDNLVRKLSARAETFRRV